MPLDILITNTRQGDGSTSSATGTNATTGNRATAATKDSAVKTTARSVYAHQVLSTAKSAAVSTAKFAESQYGDFTGDYIGQRKIDNQISIAENLISIASTTIMGGMAGGFVGAAFGFGISVFNTGVQYGQAKFTEQKQISLGNMQAGFNAQRLGSILVNGNR